MSINDDFPRLEVTQPPAPRPPESAAAMASATPNPFAWLRGHLGLDAGARTSRAPRDAGGRPRRRAFASLSVAGAAVAGDATLVAETPTWGEENRVTREELGRATWLFLHTLAAQYPEDPTRQQARDARDLVSIMTRAYPCAECARHFEEVVRRVPPDVSSGAAFRRWTCEVHNEVNVRLGKPEFDCSRVDERWAGLACDGDDDEETGCAVRGRGPGKGGARGVGGGGGGEGRRRLGMDAP